MDQDNEELYQEVTDMDAEESGLQVRSVPDGNPEEPEEVEASNTTAKPMETEFSGHYEWEIRNFAKLADKQISETFEVGTYLWRLLCFPKQNSQPYKHVSVFLEYPEAQFTPANLSPKASFKLIIRNHKDSKNDFKKEAVHTFTAEQVDWGFSQMLPLTDINVNTGNLREDGTLVVRVEITIQRDERFTYDSRTETGYVGLKNQGATCYMNSLLQYLFHVPLFRKAVYHMPVPENEDASKSLPVALQSLFYRLQYARSAVSTKELTKSFGWTSYDAFMQHDVQELNRVLCEKLEEKMKNTKVEKAINELFEGYTYNFIECINVAYKSSRKESFMDLQLDVKGCRNVYESFDKYTEVEVLNGPNQYKTDDFGLQDARKGILFENFPPVLQLQLKRFEYDFQRDAMVKINDRYEFYDELDLDAHNGKYLAPGADRSVRNLYRLHSVLVHSGGVHGGHYYAYIRPDGKTWCKFDDDRVSREDERQAMDAQFGGGDDDLYSPSTHTGGYGPAPPSGGLKYAKFSNAYMLVYVRVKDWATIMCDVGKNEIQKHLLDRLEREMQDKEARHRDKMEAHLYCSLKVATDEDFRAQVGDVSHFDLVDHERLPPERCHYRLRKQTKFAEFKEEVARRTGVPPSRQRFWTWKRRHNGTYRPERPLTPAEEASQLVDLKEIREMARDGGHAARSALMDIRLYLETLPEHPEDITPVGRDGSLLLFFKYFDPLKQTLTYVGHHLVPPKALAGAVGSHLIEELMDEREAEEAAGGGAGAEPGARGGPVLLFEEVKFEPGVMVQPLDRRKTLADMEMQHGDVVIFQRALSEQQIAEAGVKYPTANAYLSYIHNRRQVHFKRLEEPQGPPAVTLELLRDTVYDEVASALASALHLPDPSKLRFTRHNYFSSSPMKQPVRFRGLPTLEALLTHQSHPTDTIYFEVLDLPVQEMDQLKTVKVSFHGERGEYVGEQHSMRLRRDAAVSDLLAELAKRLQQAADAAADAAAEAQAPAAPPAAGAAPPPLQAPAPGSQGGAAAAAAAAAADREALAAAAAAAAAGRPMRLLEFLGSKIYKVVEPSDTIESLNDNYWQLRAEFVPEEQLALRLGPGDFLLHLAHCVPPPMPPDAAKALAARERRRKAAAAAAAAAAQGQQGPGAAAAAAPADAEAERNGGGDENGNGGGDAPAARTTSGGVRPMEADDRSETEAEEADMEGAEAEGDTGGPRTALQRCGHKAVHRALVENLPGAAFGDPVLIAVRAHETMGQLRSRLQVLLGAPPEEFSRCHLIFMGKTPCNAYLNDSDDLTDYLGRHSDKMAPHAAAVAAAGGPTRAVLMDPTKLALAVVREDTAGPGGARRQPPSSSRYAYEKPVKIYG